MMYPALGPNRSAGVPACRDRANFDRRWRLGIRETCRALVRPQRLPGLLRIAVSPAQWCDGGRHACAPQWKK